MAEEIGAGELAVHSAEDVAGAIVATPSVREIVRVYVEDDRLVAVLRTILPPEEGGSSTSSSSSTAPADEALYFALKPHSTNLGELDHRAVRANQPQAIVSNPQEDSSSSASATP